MLKKQRGNKSSFPVFFIFSFLKIAIFIGYHFPSVWRTLAFLVVQICCQLIVLGIYFKFIYLFIYFCCAGSSSLREGPLQLRQAGATLHRGARASIAASPVAEHRLQTRRLSSCGSRSQPLRGMWDPPRPGLEPVSPAPAGRLSTTAPPGKPRHIF